MCMKTHSIPKRVKCTTVGSSWWWCSIQWFPVCCFLFLSIFFTSIIYLKPYLLIKWMMLRTKLNIIGIRRLKTSGRVIHFNSCHTNLESNDENSCRVNILLCMNDYPSHFMNKVVYGFNINRELLNCCCLDTNIGQKPKKNSYLLELVHISLMQKFWQVWIDSIITTFYCHILG